MQPDQRIQSNRQRRVSHFTSQCGQGDKLGKITHADGTMYGGEWAQGGYMDITELVTWNFLGCKVVG